MKIDNEQSFWTTVMKNPTMYPNLFEDLKKINRYKTQQN